MKSNLAKNLNPEDKYIEGSLLPEKTKVRVNMFIDGDTLMEVRAMAKKSGSKYQTLLNKLLRDAVFNQKTQAEQINERLGNIEGAVKALYKK